jgi:hypothetical protein
MQASLIWGCKVLFEVLATVRRIEALDGLQKSAAQAKR